MCIFKLLFQVAHVSPSLCQPFPPRGPIGPVAPRSPPAAWDGPRFRRPPPTPGPAAEAARTPRRSSGSVICWTARRRLGSARRYPGRRCSRRKVSLGDTAARIPVADPPASRISCAGGRHLLVRVAVGDHIPTPSPRHAPRAVDGAGVQPADRVGDVLPRALPDRVTAAVRYPRLDDERVIAGPAHCSAWGGAPHRPPARRRDLGGAGDQVEVLLDPGLERPHAPLQRFQPGF